MQRARNLFAQNKIAIIWDFDKTLIPYDMQRPLFEHYGIDERTFWEESNELPNHYRARGYELVSDQLYLLHILSYVKAGRFAGLTNSLLRQLGAQLTFYAGLPMFFQTLKEHISANPEFRIHDIAVEHYVVSSGLRQMILGSAIAPHLDGVWACEFLEESAPGPGFLDRDSHSGDDQPGEISQILYAIDDTTKTRAVFEINKGANLHPQINVNATIPRDDRRVPFENMIYVADGPSDVPVFSVVNQNGGKTFGVYSPGSPSAFRKAYDLERHRRVQSIGPADYTPGSPAYLWLFTTVDEIAQRIVAARRTNLEQQVGRTSNYRPAASSVFPVMESVELTDPVPGTAGQVIDVSPIDEPSDYQIDDVTLEPGGGASAAEGVHMPIADLVANDVPLLRLPSLISPADAASSDQHDPQETLLSIISEISADTRWPVTMDELRELRQYVAGRLNARSTSTRRTRGSKTVKKITRADIESQLEAIRRRGT